MKSILVIGSGVAGMTAALEAIDSYEVTLLTKSDLAQSNTRYAQGGVAVVTTEDDTVESHVNDTLIAGAGLSDEDTVRVLCAEGPEVIDELIERGVKFDQVDGHLAHGLEAAHSHARILHAGGDATGAGIAYALIDQLRASKVTVRESTTAVDLVMDDGRAVGVTLLDGEVIRADIVILATGGAGQLFPYTTNPEIATGDGVAMALRAGAVVSDLEFYQFHPTSLDAPGNFLVSEAVRGEGAVLVDRDGKRFMLGVHPDAELAPRDVVARGIAAQMARQQGVPVRLDATALGVEFLARRFPNIDAACRAQGFDWGNEPIPVTPAAHYWMGGIRTDEWGRTSIPGLYAVGEVACNGLHGANRLASNSLLEGAVYGTRCIAALADPPPVQDWDVDWAQPSALDLADRPDADGFTRDDLQTLMWEAVGLTRTGDGMRAAVHRLAAFSTPPVTDAKSAEDANLLIVSRAVVVMALAREESRGGHYRGDFPDTLPALAHHSAAARA
ncbi:MAG: L-aspartate oxidase [Actinomycetota bacterium]|nr:L-aspartate oxidase [Actinomycetota bacterium]